MATLTRCPECRAEVVVRRDGFVDSHPGIVGNCPFKRTARSGQNPEPKKLTSAERAELSRKKAAFALDQVKRRAHRERERRKL